MAERGRPLPKFGEWDVNNPASSEGFTVIFNKARNEKKTRGNSAGVAKIISATTTTTQHIENVTHPPPPSPPAKNKWLCCVRL